MNKNINKNIIEKWDELKSNQKDLINKYKENFNLSIKLTQNYCACWAMSDLELRRDDFLGIDSLLLDPVYKKLYEGFTSKDFKEKTRNFFYPYMIKIENRKMNEEEYNYFLENSMDQIIRDNVINEFVSEKSLISKSSKWGNKE